MVGSKKFLFNWVVNGEVALGSIPNNKNDLEFLISQKIKVIFSLCEINDQKFFDDLKKRFRWEGMILPDHKSEQELDKNQIISVISRIEKLREEGPLFLHCYASIERSPSIAIAWLIAAKKISFNNAYDYISQMHPTTNLLSSQIKAIRDLT